jgi:hypothetical protein
MNKNLITAAFFLGAIAIVWVGAGFIGTSMLALAMTLVIGAVYGLGALELHRFRQATAALRSALMAVPADLPELGGWLDTVPAALQNAVRLRIEGERVGLPGPALTPYLVGLLVMLGMLGTFLGMVVTLNGAVFALEKTTDLDAIRSALAVPIKGLGLAFGTSVAGVASSAMLGLMSVLCRRERMLAGQQLDTRIATVLRRFSLTHQRQETFKALQSQSQALPMVVDRLQAMMTQMECMHRQLGEQLSDRLLANQDGFHGEVKRVYTDLATAVDHSLRASLGQTAQLAGESIKPVVEAALNGLAREATHMHERLAATVQTQLDGVSERFSVAATTVADTWTAALGEHQEASNRIVSGLSDSLESFNDSFDRRSGALIEAAGENHNRLQQAHADSDRQRQQAWTRSLEEMAAALTHELQQGGAQTVAQQQRICDTLTRTTQDLIDHAQTSAGKTLNDATRLIASAEELMRSRITAEATWLEQHNERMDGLAGLLQTELGALRQEEALRGTAAVERLGHLQTALTGHLTTLGTALEAPITRLIETASEAPRAAAEVIGQLRQEISKGVARDNELLEERSRILETLNVLLGAINHASVEQRSAIDALVVSSAAALQSAAGTFSDTVAAEGIKLADSAAHVTGSAVDVASLSEALGVAVGSFNEANEKLIANLQRIEGAMEKATLRGDEQLAYYVAQAREIIDLTMASHKAIIAAEGPR